MPGSRPERGKGQRSHHRQELGKADTFTQTQTHGCCGYQAKYPNSAQRGVRIRSLRQRLGVGEVYRAQERLSFPETSPRASVPRGAYRVDEHSAGAGRADREAGAGRVRNVHGAAAVPGGAWACLLCGCGAAAGGGSFERGGSKPPRAVALRTATALDLGRRHLSQDGGRSGPPAEHAQERRKRKYRLVGGI